MHVRPVAGSEHPLQLGIHIEMGHDSDPVFGEEAIQSSDGSEVRLEEIGLSFGERPGGDDSVGMDDQPRERGCRHERILGRKCADGEVRTIVRDRTIRNQNLGQSLHWSEKHAHLEAVQKTVVFVVLAVAVWFSTTANPPHARAWEGPLCTYEATTAVGALSRPGQALTDAASRRNRGGGPLVGASPNTRSVTPICAPDLLCRDVPSPVGRESAHTTPTVAARALSPDAWQRVRRLRDRGELDDALREAARLELAFPRLADRFALARGELLLELARPLDAERAFAAARQSPEPTVAARARVGEVRARIAADKRDADDDLQKLLEFYPALPIRSELRFELARSRERLQEFPNAVRIYQDLDLQEPGSQVAASARARLQVLAARRIPVRPRTDEQEVTRLETLARRGPHALAREEASRLLEARMPRPLRQRVRLVAARIARIEGRFDDASRHLAEGASAGAEGDEARQRELRRVRAASESAESRRRDAARKKVARLRRNRPWARVPQPKLLAIVRVAAPAGLTEPLNSALGALARARRLNTSTAFTAAVLASGIGSDDHVLELLEPVVQLTNHRGVAARYHRARTLERMGRYTEAEAEFLRVRALDRSETRWYAMWSEQRLWTVREAMLCDCSPVEMAAPSVGSSGEGARIASLRGMVAGPVPLRLEGTRSPELAALRATAPAGDPLNYQDLAESLGPLVERHEDAYPWFGRAQDALRLGDAAAATDELNAAYLAWREARGRPLRRSGLEAVFRGVEAPRRRVSPSMRRARRELTEQDRAVLVELTSVLGDEGTASGLAGFGRIRTRPRAYEATVERAARKHGLDPNLLLAVMRVESVYQKRIVSNAGAVGLMQIMPRTARHIAHALEVDDFTVDRLLDPEVNVDFAAWYLASLIERFDGHLPLAIASYNGGPHNVRRWLSEHAERMPLDAFLERIPFSQTHRYVRRVLTHYAAYRSQQGLPMERLRTGLPSVRPDPLAF